MAPSASAAIVAMTATVLFVSSDSIADADGWETVAKGRITIKARSRPGSAIREIVAEGEIAAPPQDVHEAITNPERFSSFMPYVKEARVVGERGADGLRVVYTRLEFPVIAGRDFVIADRVVQALAPDGGGEFVNEWREVDGAVPRRPGVVRVPTNTGSWRVKPESGGKASRVTYRFTVDPGGAIPGFLADWGNRVGVGDVFRAVEKEARRLNALRFAR